MEIKATLNKPYTATERLDFIVSQNHLYGYEIKETEQALEAWGLTEEEIAKKEKQSLKDSLVAKLNEYDLKSIRSIRAKESGVATQEDLDKLAELEEQAELTREQIRQLGE